MGTRVFKHKIRHFGVYLWAFSIIKGTKLTWLKSQKDALCLVLLHVKTLIVTSHVEKLDASSRYSWLVFIISDLFHVKQEPVKKKPKQHIS